MANVKNLSALPDEAEISFADLFERRGMDDFDPREKDDREDPGMAISERRRTTRRELGRTSDLEFDFHGYRVAEARRILDTFLSDWKGRGLRSVKLIVGKGLHSPSMGSPLKDSFQKTLDEYQKTRRIKSFRKGKNHEGGSGVFIVTF